MDNSINIVVWEEDQILKMPDEVFTHIFSYVPIARRQNAVGMVCKRFYDLLCDLEKDMHPLKLSWHQIYDDEIFDSIITSGRRFNNLTIDLNNLTHEGFDRVKAVAQKFGPRIEKLELYSSASHRDRSEISESQLITILDCFPKAQEITLCVVRVRQSFNIDGEDLKLQKLAKLAIYKCKFDTPAILNKIPADVLQELVLVKEINDETPFQSFMNRQSRIKKLKSNAWITFDHLQLENLGEVLIRSIDFVAMTNQQPKLRSVDFGFIDDDRLSALCNLKYLEKIKHIRTGHVSISVFKNLKNLTRLKELWFDCIHCDSCDHLLALSMMKCLPIEKLALHFLTTEIPEEIFVQMSLNYRRLKEFDIFSSCIKIITTILENFHSLESLLYKFYSNCRAPDVLIINDDFQRHENLKQLEVTDIDKVENSSALLKLLNACPNLERIELSTLSGISSDNFKHIIESHPHLTRLTLDFDDFELNEEIINFLKSCSHKLVSLHLSGLSSSSTRSEIKTLFDEDFPNITFYPGTSGTSGRGGLRMKKRSLQEYHFK